MFGPGDLPATSTPRPRWKPILVVGVLLLGALVAVASIRLVSNWKKEKRKAEEERRLAELRAERERRRTELAPVEEEVRRLLEKAAAVLESDPGAAAELAREAVRLAREAGATGARLTAMKVLDRAEDALGFQRAAGPDDQKTFTGRCRDFAQAYERAKGNDLKQPQVCTDRNRWWKEFAEAHAYRFKSWEAKVLSVDALPGGCTLTVVIQDLIAIQLRHRGIRESDPLYKKVASLDRLQNVRVTGIFGDHQERGLNEWSITDHGSMTEPGLFVQFTDIEEVPK